MKLMEFCMRMYLFGYLVLIKYNLIDKFNK